VSNAESSRDRIRQPSVLDNQNGAAVEIANASDERAELLVHLRADRTLRAMLENQNGIGFRSVQKLFEIMIL